MASSQQTQRTPLPIPSYHAPLVISPLRHKTPSLPLIRHSPSLQTLNFHPLGLQPLNSFRAKLHSRPGTEPIVEEVDPTPRPLRIKKIRKSPSMPFGGVWDSKLSSQLPRRGPPPTKSFLGLGFPPQPKPRSSSAGVLLADKTGNTSGAHITNISAGRRSDTMRRASSQRHGEIKELPGAGMAWLQRPKSTRPLNTLSPASTQEAIDDMESCIPFFPTPPYQSVRKLSSRALPTSRNSSGDATAGTSHRSSSYQSARGVPNIPETQDSVLDGTKKAATDLRRIASTGGNGRRNIFDFRNLNTSTKEHVTEGSADKTPTRGWKEKMFPKDFFTRSGTSPKKEVKMKGRERASSESSTTTVKTMDIARPPTSIGDSSFTRIDIPTGHGWCEHSGWQSQSSPGAWQLDGHVATSSLAGSGIRSRNTLNDSVLGIFEGSVGGMSRTRLKKAGHWKSPTLQLQMEVVAETKKVPISYLGGSGSDKVVWVSVELDGIVDKGTESFEGRKIGLDVGVLMDISAYTSSTSFASMKLQAKRLVEAMETSRDRVAVMTFPIGSSNTGSMSSSRDGIHVLNSSGSVAKQQLMDDIALLAQNKWDIDPATRNVRAAVQASVKKLKGMPLNTARYGTHRHAHLFLLTSKLDVGEIELLPEVFFGEIQIHIIGIGALFWPRSEMGASGWCFPTQTLGSRPTPTKTKMRKFEDDDVAKLEDMTIEGIITLLRKAVDLGVLQDLNIELRAGENCNILAVMGDLKYNKFLPGEKRTLLVQVQVEDMPIPDNDEYDLDGNHEGMPRWVILERQLEATLGELKGQLLSVKASYRHSNFSEVTTFSTQRDLEISRFAEDSLWRFSPTGNKIIHKEKSPPLTLIVAEDYVKNVLIQRVASMHSSPSRALRAVKEIASSSLSRGLNIDEVSRELVYRDKVEKRFKAAGARYGESSEEEMLIDFTDRSNDHTPMPGDSRKTNMGEPPSTPRPHALISQVTLVNRDCRYRGSRELHNEDRAPFIAAMDSSPDTERPNIDPDDEAQRIWQEIKMRQRGVSSGSIKRRSVRSKKASSFYGREQLQNRFGDSNNSGEDTLSTVYSSISISRDERELDSENDVERRMISEKRCRSGQETLHSLVTLRDVREIDFGPWAM